MASPSMIRLDHVMTRCLLRLLQVADEASADEPTSPYFQQAFSPARGCHSCIPGFGSKITSVQQQQKRLRNTYGVTMHENHKQNDTDPTDRLSHRIASHPTPHT